MSDPAAQVKSLKALCVARGVRLGTAESCTGGLLSSWLTADPGASQFFVGGVTCYARSVKNDILGVPLSLMQAHGEVSLPVARVMAEGAREKLKCDWTVSVTGIAGPSGGSVEKPVGFVCFAVAGPGFVSLSQQQFDASGGRQDIQRQAALFAIDFLLNAMR